MLWRIFGVPYDMHADWHDIVELYDIYHLL